VSIRRSPCSILIGAVRRRDAQAFTVIALMMMLRFAFQNLPNSLRHLSEVGDWRFHLIAPLSALCM
jgi:hypothetical protein